MSVVLGLPYDACVWISAAVAIIYTLLGGLYSVAYTDVIQLLLMFISMVGHFIELLSTTYLVVNCFFCAVMGCPWNNKFY